MTKDLFRKEAIRHRTRALFGDVILAAPLSTWVVTGVLFSICIGLAVFGVLGSIEVDGARLSLWKWVFADT